MSQAFGLLSEEWLNAPTSLESGGTLRPGKAGRRPDGSVARKLIRGLMGAALLLVGQALAGCEESALGPFLRLLPVDQRGLQLRPDPPAPQQALPPTGTGGGASAGGGTASGGGAVAGGNAAGGGTAAGGNAADGVTGGGGVAPSAVPSLAPEPTPALTPAPLDLMGCTALAASEVVTLRGAPTMGIGTPRLGPAGTGVVPIAPEALLGRRYEVDLPNGSGTVALQLNKASGFNLFLDQVVTATVSDVNGQMRQLRGQRPNASCGALVNRLVISLNQGTYYLRFVGADRVGLAFGAVED